MPGVKLHFRLSHEVTDVGYLLLFLAVAFGMLWLDAQANYLGNVLRLSEPIDYQGRLCGYDEEVGNPGIWGLLEVFHMNGGIGEGSKAFSCFFLSIQHTVCTTPCLMVFYHCHQKIAIQ